MQGTTGHLPPPWGWAGSHHCAQGASLQLGLNADAQREEERHDKMHLTLHSDALTPGALLSPRDGLPGVGHVLGTANNPPKRAFRMRTTHPSATTQPPREGLSPGGPLSTRPDDTTAGAGQPDTAQSPLDTAARWSCPRSSRRKHSRGSYSVSPAPPSHGPQCVLGGPVPGVCPLRKLSHTIFSMGG